VANAYPASFQYSSRTVERTALDGKSLARQHSVEIRLAEGYDDRCACSLVLIENDGGQVRAMLVVA
jgi:hypothetical protein